MSHFLKFLKELGYNYDAREATVMTDQIPNCLPAVSVANIVQKNSGDLNGLQITRLRCDWFND